MKKVFVVPSSLNKRLISTLMSSKSSEPAEPKSFSLKCSSDFASRSGNVFGKLETLEQSHETWISENQKTDSFEECDASLSTVQPDSEIFKKPFRVRNWKRKATAAPYFKKRCQKWTKYSLEDTPVSSDATNATVAFEFLDELRKRKRQDCDEADNNAKILFNKPKHKMSVGISLESKGSADTATCEKQSDVKKLTGRNIELDHLRDENYDSN